MLNSRAIALASALACTAPAWALTDSTATTAFNAVGELNGASGVLVADNWVLTAAHVAGGLVAGQSAFVGLQGSSVVDAVYTFSAEGFPNNDIALVHLSTAVSANTPVLYDTAVRNNQLGGLQTLTMASALGDTNSVGTTSALQWVPSYTSDTGVTYTVNWLVTYGGSHVESGDSGSALFKGAVTDSFNSVLLGIGSGQPTLSNNELGSAYVLLAPYKTWINQTMAASGQSVKWASAVPEPSSVAFMGLGMAILVVRARRRSAA